MTPVLGEIVGWELLLVVGLIALLFGSSQIPKFARSIGEASREFRHGIDEGQADDGADAAVAKDAAPKTDAAKADDPKGAAPNDDGPKDADPKGAAAS